MDDRSDRCCFVAILAGNLFLWWVSIVVSGLSVGALSYDVDSWMPFDYQPVLETHKVTTASLIVSTFCLHLAALGWLALAFRRQWLVHACMMGNALTSLLQLTIGVGVLVVQKQAWPYFQLISLHLCFERFNRQRGRRVARSVEFNTTAEDDDSSVEEWLPTGPSPSKEPEDDFEDAFFDGFRTLPTRPGPAVPSECLPTDLLTAAGALLVISAIVSVFLAYCYHQLPNDSNRAVPQTRRTTFSIDNGQQYTPSVIGGHPGKPPRHGSRNQDQEDGDHPDL